MEQVFRNVKEMAEAWGLSEHRVQVLCKTGRIPGVQRFGRSYMIPADARKPRDGRSKGGETQEAPPGDVAYLPMPRKAPFLVMTDLFPGPGMADQGARMLEHHPEAQALYRAEIAYCRGEIDKVVAQTQCFLGNNSGFFAVTAAGMLLALAAMWQGDIHLWRKAKIHLCEAPARDEHDQDLMGLSLACVDSTVRDLSSFPSGFPGGGLVIYL